MKYLIDFTVLILLYFLVFLKRWKPKGRDVLLINTLMYVYLSFVLFFTLMPIVTSLPFLFSHSYAPMNFIPFIDVSVGRGDFLRQVILNMVMTVPFGVLFPLTQRKKGTVGRTVFFCFLMSLSIELLQPLINDYRSSDITDIITNVLGSLIGYGLYKLLKPIINIVLLHIKSQK